MFQKNDIIFSETLGVCKITNITKLTGNRGGVYDYYVLKSVFNKEKVSYIPVENHKVNLRNLITYEEAVKMKETSYDKADENIKKEIDYVLTEKKTEKKK